MRSNPSIMSSVFIGWNCKLSCRQSHRILINLIIFYCCWISQKESCIHKPIIGILIYSIQYLKQLCSNKTIITINNQNNIILSTIMFDIHVHITHYTQMLQIMDYFYLIFQFHIRFSEVFINLIGRVIRRIIIHP